MPSTEQLDQTAPSIEIDRARIPSLDLAPLFLGDGRHRLIEQVRQACLDPGFFYVNNSGVDDEIIQAAQNQIQRFFELPDNSPVKQGVHNGISGGMKGWAPIFSEPSYQKDTVAHVEVFELGQPLSEEQSRSLGIEPNIWPDLPGFRENILEYYQAITRLGRALSQVFSELLDCDRDFISSRSGNAAPRTMRLLHYPANNAPVSDQDVGIAAHTDFECFTIMNQTAAGLELTNVDGQWCAAPSDIGTFTIILGDMMERLSNGHFKATGHRVVNTPWTRYSMVLFFAFDGDYSVEPLPRFTSQDNPPRFQPITQNVHIERELARASENQGTSRFPEDRGTP